jgi:Uma2 family endonuclease
MSHIECGGTGIMVQAPEKILTLAEFLKLPETKPASEYVNGKIIQKPMPQGKHSRLQGKLVTRINETFEVSKTALAFPELRCTFGGRSIVPDISVFAWDRIPVDEEGDLKNVFTVAPDWTIEILSPGQSPVQVTRNILHCLDHGCLLGWMLDPEDRSVLIYPAGEQPIFVENLDEVLRVPELVSGLELTLVELWGWMKIMD